MDMFNQWQQDNGHAVTDTIDGNEVVRPYTIASAAQARGTTPDRLDWQRVTPYERDRIRESDTTGSEWRDVPPTQNGVDLGRIVHLYDRDGVEVGNEPYVPGEGVGAFLAAVAWCDRIGGYEVDVDHPGHGWVDENHAVVRVVEVDA